MSTVDFPVDLLDADNWDNACDAETYFVKLIFSTDAANEKLSFMDSHVLK